MPLYEYRCPDCKDEWEAYHKVDVRMEEYCTTCTTKAEILMSTPSTPVVYEYYSEQLDSVVTGPKHKKQLAKSKGLEEF